MKLIKPKAEIIEQESGIEGIYRQIEKAARTCYKSEGNITGDSAEKIVERLIASNHTAMLEHGTVYLLIIIPRKAWNRNIVTKYYNNPYSRVVAMHNDNDELYYVTTNYRVLVEHNWLSDLKYLCEPTENHTKRVTVKFTCDRGISHELVRHRTFSFAQESSRYCNYSTDKFGNELTFICPSWMDFEVATDVVNKFSGRIAGDCWWNSKHSEVSGIIEALSFCEDSYLDAIKTGYKPQQARAVLPNALKTEVVMTGFIDSSGWENFFNLRYLGTTGAPHPDMKALVKPLYKEFVNRNLLADGN